METLITLEVKKNESLSDFVDVESKPISKVSFLQKEIVLTPCQYGKVLNKLKEIEAIILEEPCSADINRTALQLIADAAEKGAHASL